MFEDMFLVKIANKGTSLNPLKHNYIGSISPVRLNTPNKMLINSSHGSFQKFINPERPAGGLFLLSACISRMPKATLTKLSHF